MIVLKNICKNWGEKEVLKNLSFHIAPNEKVGIIGLNGTGKTTLLNIIAGIVKPDSGFIRVNGAEHMLENYPLLRELSYVSGTRSQLWEDLRIRDSYDHCIKMYRMEKEDAKKRLDLLTEVFDMKKLLMMRPKSLSLGERMRCELVYALLAEPKIFLLDEAMIGLDVTIKHKVMEYFERYRKETEATMIFTSHNLWEIEKLCDRVILLDRGSVIFDGSMEQIMRKYAPFYRLEAKIKGGLPDFEDLPLEKFYYAGEEIEVVFDKQKIETAQILKHIMRWCKLEDVQLHEPNLEETIQKIYKRERMFDGYNH